jgi:hypothetical protein
MGRHKQTSGQRYLVHLPISSSPHLILRLLIVALAGLGFNEEVSQERD